MSQAQLDKYRDINVHDEWWEFIYAQHTEDMQEVGIEVGDIEFSGFWSQGDGASFTGKISNLTLYLSKFHKDDEFPELRKVVEQEYYIEVSWKRYSSHYVHENTLEFTTEFESPYWLRDFDNCELRQAAADAMDKLCDAEAHELREAVKENIQAICRKLYRQLEEEYEYLTSDEAVTEAIIANDLHKE